MVTLDEQFIKGYAKDTLQGRYSIKPVVSLVSSLHALAGSVNHIYVGRFQSVSGSKYKVSLEGQYSNLDVSSNYDIVAFNKIDAIEIAPQYMNFLPVNMIQHIDVSSVLAGDYSYSQDWWLHIPYHNYFSTPGKELFTYTDLKSRFVPVDAGFYKMATFFAAPVQQENYASLQLFASPNFAGKPYLRVAIGMIAQDLAGVDYAEKRGIVQVYTPNGTLYQIGVKVSRNGGNLFISANRDAVGFVGAEPTNYMVGQLQEVYNNETIAKKDLFTGYLLDRF